MLIPYKCDNGEEGELNPTQLGRIQKWKEHHNSTRREVGIIVRMGYDNLLFRGWTIDQFKAAVARGDPIISRRQSTARDANGQRVGQAVRAAVPSGDVLD